MSKVAARLKVLTKATSNIDHSSKLRVTIGAGMASSAPPLGSQLAQRNINIAEFCKEFNNRTKDIKEGIPIPCRVKVNLDKTLSMVLHKPPVTYFLKQAAGIHKGAVLKGEVAGKITLKHLYEIALIKSEDPPLQLMDLKHICEMIVGIARTCGIQIVRDLDPKEHAEFMKQRQENLENHMEKLKAIQQGKLLRAQ